MIVKRNILLLTVVLAAALLSALPLWEMTVYPTSTIAYGNVTLEGEPAAQGDIVYAFVNSECRGKQPVKMSDGKAYMTMNIQGLADHEPVYFKIWDASADSVYDVNFTTYTKPNFDIGYPPDVLPINGIRAGVTFFFPPEELEMHPYEIRQLDLGFYCNTTKFIKDVRVFGAENLEVVPDGLTLNITAVSDWTGEEKIEIELLNEAREVIEYGDVLILVKPN
ncbi:MAG: hypothetical protein K9N07_09860 [Candidatus Cloacimonetes bacterium]|nr:hypothetical protein [Candidatus Cloacimonadota bacterium]